MINFRGYIFYSRANVTAFWWRNPCLNTGYSNFMRRVISTVSLIIFKWPSAISLSCIVLSRKVDCDVCELVLIVALPGAWPYVCALGSISIKTWGRQALRSKWGLSLPDRIGIAGVCWDWEAARGLSNAIAGQCWRTSKHNVTRPGAISWTANKTRIINSRRCYSALSVILGAWSVR